MSDLVIEVDGLAVEVDREEYETDAEGVVKAVRNARAQLRLPGLTDEELEPDYKSQYGDAA